MLARSLDPQAVFAVGPIPFNGEDKTFPGGYTIRAEKAPNARGVRRVLEAVAGEVLDATAMQSKLESDASIRGLLVTGNYPSEWVTPALASAIGDERFLVLLDTLPNNLTERADVLLPAATWVEKAGTFENAEGVLQSFERAIPAVDYCKSEAQIAIEMLAIQENTRPVAYNPAMTRQAMASQAALERFLTGVTVPSVPLEVESDMQLVQL